MPETAGNTIEFTDLEVGDTVHITGSVQPVETNNPENPGALGIVVLGLGSRDIKATCTVMKVELPDRRPGTDKGAMLRCLQRLEGTEGSYTLDPYNFFLPTNETVITPADPNPI